ncbi:MAG: SIMPL domain-containing protein [Proteobacteria bacterium]|nr:SIMPL domain-containing protein [Pseudomonadota bacterium]
MRFAPWALAVAAVFPAGPARADTPPPSGVVNLGASASADVTKDQLTVTFSTTKESTDAAVVQSQLKQAIDAALAEAKKVARPGQLEVQTGNFSLYPRYAPKGGTINGWQGTAELTVEGRDMPAIGQLTGRITTLTIARVGTGLSRELREKTEADASTEAIARFRAKAADYAKAFGYTGYTVREVSVNANEPPPGIVRPMMMAKAAAAPTSDDALPVEAGKSTVTVTVSGTIQLTR